MTMHCDFRHRAMRNISFIATCVASVSAQQYAGQAIPNNLPESPGAEIAFFNVFDKDGGKTTLINHFSARQNKTEVQRAVIMNSGANRDSWNYFSDVYTALNGATKLDPTVSQGAVAILVPHWANDADVGRSYPEGQTSSLAWNGTGWYEGQTNIYPTSQQSVSSFDVLDQILQYFDSVSEYPNMKQIIVGGHSTGAQMVHRYAAVGKLLGLRTPVRYWAGNPSAFLWFDSSRPVSPVCAEVDNWSHGLSNYNIEYEAGFVATAGREGVKARFDEREVAYGHGLNDFGAQAEDCGTTAEGASRGERFYNYMSSFPPNSGDTVDYYPGVGHDSAEMMSKTPGLFRLFFDNFNGNGSRHTDFGARQVAGDSPFPPFTIDG